MKTWCVSVCQKSWLNFGIEAETYEQAKIKAQDELKNDHSGEWAEDSPEVVDIVEVVL